MRNVPAGTNTMFVVFTRASAEAKGGTSRSVTVYSARHRSPEFGREQSRTTCDDKMARAGLIFFRVAR
jgi:hypothetical protein